MGLINWLKDKAHRAALVTFAAALGAFLHTTGAIPADDVAAIVTAWASIASGTLVVYHVVEAFLTALEGGSSG